MSMIATEPDPNESPTPSTETDAGISPDPRAGVAVSEPSETIDAADAADAAAAFAPESATAEALTDAAVAESAVAAPLAATSPAAVIAPPAATPPKPAASVPSAATPPPAATARTHYAEPEPPAKRDGGGLRIIVIRAVLILVALGVTGWQGWQTWQSFIIRSQTREAALERQLGTLGERLDTVHGDLRQQSQRIQDATNNNHILREELLDLGQRSVLLEENIAKLTEATRHNAENAQLSEVELLLTFGAERLNVAGDAEGARRVYALAAEVLNETASSRQLLDLRQTLVQERATLDALGPGPQALIQARLTGFADSLATLPAESPAPESRPAWQRWLAPLIDIRPAQSHVLLAPADRRSADAALQIELGLARAALERGDRDSFQQTIGRIESWLTRLWPDSPALQQRRSELDALRQAPLRPELPALGTTLQQLRAMRDQGDTP